MTTIDVWGHGPFNLPSPNGGRYSHGSDPMHGPWKCRGVDGGCGGGSDIPPHDHACCCDPCRHKAISICDGTRGCCRCIPRYLCFMFTPDTPSSSCQAKSWLVPADEGEYSLSVGSLGIVRIRNGGPSASGSSYPEQACLWELSTEAGGILSEVPIVHSGEINCMVLPGDWSIPMTLSSGCSGTLTFKFYETKKLPFVNVFFGMSETVEVTCGDCLSMCSVLCVRRGTKYSSEYTRVNFLWNGEEGRWDSQEDPYEYITPVTFEGRCYIELSALSPSTFVGDLVLVDNYACNLGMSLSATDEADNWIKISCNPCWKWKYLCGTCRCVCAELCVAGVLDNSPYSSSLTWDKDYLLWSDGLGMSIQLGADEDGNCVATVEGFTDPVGMSSCGSLVGGSVSEDIEDQLASGLVNYLYFYCKQCSENCDAGTCLGVCANVPQQLTAELEAGAWMAMVGCDECGPGFDLKTFPLYLVFVPDRGAAGEWRWIGNTIISCSSCCGVRRNYYVQVDIGCDGIVYFTVSKPGIAHTPCTAEFSFVMPCNGSGVWDFEWETELPCGVLNGCMDQGTFILRVTE